VWFDSHCHLYDLGDDEALASAIDRARAASVTDMLVPAVDAATSLRAIEIAINHRVWAAVGIHPSETAGWEESRIHTVEEVVTHPRVAAIGETGLDFYRDHAPRELQQENFAAHIELAKRYSKTLIIHTRASATTALDMLEQYGMPDRVVFHCWSGDAIELQRAVGLGGFISFAGNVSFKSADALRDAARAVPGDRLMIETDSPYLTPVPHRGKSNEPAFVTYVGAAVADARGESASDIASSTSDNARRAFALPDP
jgi:TatD DNase family protein